MAVTHKSVVLKHLTAVEYTRESVLQYPYQ
jgi:hypothetical protein